MQKNRVIRFVFGIIIAIVVIALFIYIAFISNTPIPEPTPTEFNKVNTSVEEFSVYIGESKILKTPEGYILSTDQSIPDFAKSNDSEIIFTPIKKDKGEYYINFSNESSSTVSFHVLVENKPVDWESLSNEIKTYLGSLESKYGVYVYDLSRSESLGINEEVQFPPSSTAKLPVAILAMRDVQEGKYTLADTYPVQSKFKHSTIDSIGKYPNGTELSIETYLDAMMVESNNTAWYHLVQMLGSPWGDEGVNQRTINELGVNPYFIDPYLGTAKNLGTLLVDVYNHKTLNKENADYLISMMERALKFNREGISLGLPSDIEFANKLGYHWTSDLVNFVDGALIFGHSRDYVVAILDKDIDWSSGKINLQEISKIIYKYIDN